MIEAYLGPRGRTALLELELSVEARYGPVHALRGISLAVEEGEVVALLGANGAGKTTTLRAISGTVRARGESASRPRSLPRGRRRRSRGSASRTSPRAAACSATLTVPENLRLGAYVAPRAPASDGRPRARPRALPAPRASARDQAAGTLSGGEQQMLALGRALMARPRLLMLDEPSLGLAPLIVRETLRDPRQLNREDGLTVLLVEQNARTRARVARTACVLETGRVVARRRRAPSFAADDAVRRCTWATAWPDSGSRSSAGSRRGGVFASLALAIVLIYRATRVINFAQGELATLSTYVAWSCSRGGVPYWGAFFLTIAVSFVGGVLRANVIRPSSAPRC